ncbi:MAG: hypothetical protein IMW94_01440 [Thermoanaerobacter sp.]|jgi:hypothetical protein|nr:hypothetical protein [Thermoanaerobacter sp.]
MKLSEMLKDLAENLPAEKDRDLSSRTVTLYTGRVVELRETTGLDEAIVARMLGPKFTANAAGAMLYRNALMARAVVSIDGEKAPPVLRTEDVDKFWAGFTSKEKAQIDRAYAALNEFKPEEDETLLG